MPAHTIGSSEALYRTLFDIHPEPTFTLTSDGAVLRANEAFARLVGLAADALPGRPFIELLVGQGREQARDALAALRAGVAQSWETEFRAHDGSVGLAHLTMAPLVVDGVLVGAHGVARDLTVYRAIEEQLQARVFVDPLTGLANRTQLHEGVERAQHRIRPGERLTVLSIDLDDFKVVNNGLGHATGDRLLVTVGERLRRATHSGDLVARLASDEFAVLLDRCYSPAEIATVVERITSAIAAPIDLGNRVVVVSASVGVAHWDGSATPAELLRHAGLAMNHAKTLGKSRHVVFDAGMHEAARDRLELASALRGAIGRGEISAAFQPIIDLATGRVVKAEALARWRHAERGPISPGVFIPIAEDTGLVDELGTLMLRCACEQLRRWEVDADSGTATSVPGVTVNVSGRQIERGTIVDAVRAALAATGVDPSRVTLELTESVAMRHPEQVLVVLGELTSLGVRLAIDDFGTGYSSLAYLHRFPVDVLKIDKSFVDELAVEDTDRARDAASLIRTVLGVAHTLGLQTVAEGVETVAQRDHLRALGCEMAQGYLFGRPGPGNEVRQPNG